MKRLIEMVLEKQMFNVLYKKICDSCMFEPKYIGCHFVYEYLNFGNQIFVQTKENIKVFRILMKIICKQTKDKQ